MARDHQPDRAPTHGAADRASGAGPADHPRDLAVACRRAGRDAADGGQHEAIPSRAILEVDRQFAEGRKVTVEERPERLERPIEVAEGGAAALGVGDLDRWRSESPPEA